MHDFGTVLEHQRLLRGEGLSCQNAYTYWCVGFCAPKPSTSNTNVYAAADTIRILVATDSHVGYEERDAIRKDDSWRSFDEVMQLAKTQDVCTCSLGGLVVSNIS